jgi:hypothetical protein
LTGHGADARGLDTLALQTIQQGLGLVRGHG